MAALRGLRRIREQALERGRRRNGGAPSKGGKFLRIVSSVLAAAVLTYIVSLGGTPLDIREGQRATRDYIARVEFSWTDKNQTEFNRLDAEKRALNVYEEDLSSLNILENDLVDLIGQLIEPSVGTASGQDLLTKWELSPEEVKVLRPEAMERGLTPLKKKIGALFNEIKARQVMEQARLNTEQNADRFRIKVLSKGAAEPKLMSIDKVIVKEAAGDTLYYGLMRDQFEDLSPDFRKVLSNVIARQLKRGKATLTYSEQLSKDEGKKARASALEAKRVIKPDDLILRQGDVATAEAVQLLRKENGLFWSSLAPAARLRRLAGTAIVISIIVGIGAIYVNRFIPNRVSLLHALALALICVACIGLVKLLAAMQMTYLVPVSAVAILFTIVFSPGFALGMSFLLVMIIGVTLSYDFTAMVTFLAGSVAGILGAARIRKRTRLIKAGFLIGLAQAVTLWGMWLARQWESLPLQLNSVLVLDSAMAFLSGVVGGFLLSGALPFIERLFNVVTEIGLLELSDQNHPLLRRLLLEAPGTYHHSFIVGSLAEAAAEATGANSLLARIGSYYHDIGKLARPEYFVENQSDGNSPHDKLSPAMSALIIISHVKEGLELARAHRLQPRLVDLIAQHHGTSLVEYFYHSALSNSNGNEAVTEDPFRYPGPKPQSKEASIILLADAVEAAARTLSEPSPARIEHFVDEIVTKRLADAQLDESGLTLTEVGRIKWNFTRVLTAIYHSRIKYPQALRVSARGKGNGRPKGIFASGPRLTVENPD